MLTSKFTLKPIVVAGAAVFTLLAAPLATDLVWNDQGGVPSAMAEEGGGQGTVNKGGHHGTRPEGKGGPSWSPGASPWPEGKGPPADSDYNPDGKGPRMGGDADKMGKPESGSQGGAPRWAAQELEDIGRLNVGRAPANVLQRAEDNAIVELASNYQDFYSAAVVILVNLQDGTIDKATAEAQLADLLRASGDLRIDSPLANLAFYKDILDGDKTVTAPDGTVIFQATSDAELNALAAIFFGGAADKTKPVVAETVHAVDIILALEEPTPIGQDPVNLDLAQDQAMADVSAVFQTAVVTVHDE
jgi:hypothetical protein